MRPHSLICWPWPIAHKQKAPELQFIVWIKIDSLKVDLHKAYTNNDCVSAYVKGKEGAEVSLGCRNKVTKLQHNLSVVAYTDGLK